MAGVSPVKLPSDECHWTSVNIGSGQLVQVMGHQAITWASVDQDPCRHMASSGSNELNLLHSNL